MRRRNLVEIEGCFPDCDGIWNPLSMLETESIIRSRLPMGETPASVDNISALLQAVRLSCLKNQLSEAKNFLAYADQLLTKFEDEDKLKLQIRYKLEEGRYHTFMKSPARALEAFRNAWEMSKDNKKLDFFSVDAVYMISMTLPAKQGLEWLNLALTLAEDSTNTLTKKWLPYLQLAVGWDQFDKHNFGNALEFFSKGESNCDANSSLLRTILWSKARVLRSLKKNVEAIDVQQEILVADGGAPCERNGFVYLELAELHSGLQQEAKARDYFVLAFESLRINKKYSENYDYELREIEKKSRKKVYHS
jgi:hypothetical protein